MADYLNVTINYLYLFLAILIPSVETQLMINEATQNITRYLMMNIAEKDD